MEKFKTGLSQDELQTQLQAERADLMRKIQAGNEEAEDMAQVIAIDTELRGETPTPRTREVRIGTAEEDESQGVK